MNYTGSGKLTIEHSLFMDNVHDDDVHRDVINPWTSSGWDLEVTHSMFVNTGDMFLLQPPSDIGTITVTYNVFSGGHFAFRMGSGSGDNDAAVVSNNVFHDVYDFGDVDNVTLRNNIFAGPDPYGGDSVHTGGGDAEYNLWATGTGDFVSGTGNVTGDPGFLDASDPLGPDGVPFTDDDGFSLAATSDAIDAGTDVGETVDIRGTAITGTPDIGPYERD
jgi:hypothetical protein